MQHLDHASEPNKLWNTSYILMLVLGLFTSSASSMVNPIFSKYLSGAGASTVEIGAMVSILSWVALAFRPFSGAASDKFNKKRLMVISTLAVSLCVFAYSLTKNLTVLKGIRFLHGIAFAVSGTTQMTFSTSFIPINRMGEGLGWMGLSQIFSMAFGPNVGIWVNDNLGAEYCFVTSAAMSMLAAIILLRVPYTHSPKQELSWEKFKIKFSDFFATELIVYVILISVFSFGNGLLNTYIKLMGDDRGIANVGLFFTANSIAMVAIRPLAGKLNDKKGLSFILLPAYFIASAGMAILGFTGSVWLVMLAGVLKAIGQGAGAPAIQAETVRKLGRDRRGVAISTCYIGQDLGNGIGPILGGAVAEKFGYGTMFYAYAGLLVVTGIAYYLYQKFSKNPTT